MSAKTANRHRLMGIAAVVLISALAAETVGVLGGMVFAPLETAASDFLMRSLYAFRKRIGDPRATPSGEITLVAVDTRTQEIYGRFGLGPWLTREPFVYQLEMFRSRLNPAVLGYDILFQDTLGSWARAAGRVSESPEKLARIADEIARIKEDPTELVSLGSLPDMNRFSMEQGNSILANSFAALQERGDYPAVLACFFRGGEVDPQASSVPPWSEQDISGKGRTEESGEKIPYLLDMAIPAENVHFAGGNEKPYRWSVNATMPSRELLDYSLLGFVNGPRDDDGIMRRLPAVVGFSYRSPALGRERHVVVPSFALALALVRMGVGFPLKPGTVDVFLGDKIVVRPPGRREISVPIDSRGFMELNFAAMLRDFRMISFCDAAVPPSADPDRAERAADSIRAMIDGKIVLVGVTSAGIDVGATPIAPNTPLVFLHMTAIDNILRGMCLTPWRPAYAWPLYCGLFLLFTAACLCLPTARLGFGALLFAVFYVMLAGYALDRSFMRLPVVGPVAYIGMTAFGVTSYRFFVEERERRKIRGMFSTMVSDKVLSYLEENPESFSLKGRDMETTVLFSDIQGFTRISEALPADRLTAFLNAYLTPMTDCILRRGGYVDKYLGDGIMAVWGAPYADPRHAVEACLSAWEQQQIAKDLSQRMAREFGADLRIRIGINSGRVIAGNMGSERKFQFTVIGDVVNLAARLEPANKDFGTEIIISGATRRMAGNLIEARRLGRIRVAGKEDVADIYEMLGPAGTASPAAQHVSLRYEEALGLFESRRWEEALAVLDGILAAADDGPSRHLRRLVLAFMQSPPGPDWQGEYFRAEKT